MSYLTINRKCARCPEVESREISLEEAALLAKHDLKPPPALRVIFDGQEQVEFEYLCASCRQIALRHLGQVGKRLKHRSSTRTSVEVEKVG
jgi:hypothetical protein